MRSLRSRIHVSPVEEILLMISKALGAVYAVVSVRQPYKQFWLMIFETTTTHFSLMISETLRAVCGVESMRHPWKQFVDDF